MAVHHEIPELDRKGLRQFGVSTGLILTGLFGLAFPWFFDRGYPQWPWLLGGALVVWGVVAPSSLRPVYRAWMRFGLVMSRIMTPLIMGIMFFLLITPIACMMRLRGRDTMTRRLDSERPSYRIPSHKPPVKTLEKPF